MVNHRLLEAFDHFHPAEADRLFGDEGALHVSNSALALAPVRRVAIFAEAFLPKVDGVSKTAYLTLRYLQETGREVIVFAPDIAPHWIGSTRIVPLHSFGIPAVPETRVALPHPVVAATLDEFKPDLIHMFSPAIMSVNGMVLGRQRHIPVIANYQTDLPGYVDDYGFSLFSSALREWLRYIHNGCHLTLVPSNYTMQQLQKWGYHRLRRWGRGVNKNRFTPEKHSAAWRARLLNGRDPDSLLCLYVGRLATEKRVDLLLEVARTPGIALTIIGDGGLRDELETRFAGTDTCFTGYLYGDDLAHAYASADVFMFTGMRETFGQVVQEALASGLPAVIVDQGGITDLVTDEVNGYICPPDRQAFAAAARRLRDDPALRARMSQQARRTIEQNSWEAIMAQLEGYYHEAMRLNERFNQIYAHPQGIFPVLFPRGRGQN